MKKILTFILMLFCSLSAGVCCAEDININTPTNIETQKLNVIFDGNNYDGMNLYDISGSKFFSLKEFASLYNARLEWYSVSNKVSMKLNNRSVDFFYDTRKVSFGKKKDKLSIPSLLVNGVVYVPVDFFEMKKFSEISETVLSFDVSNQILNVTSKSNISAVRYYTKEDSTEIVIEIEEKMTHTVRKGKNSIIVAFQRGKVAKDSVIANNGAIKDISYETVGREAVFTVHLAQTPKSVKIKKYKKPLKLVMDIEHSKSVNMTKPCDIVLPDTVVESTDRKVSEDKVAAQIKVADTDKIDKSKDNTISKTTTKAKETKDEKIQPVEDIEVPIMDKKIISDESEVLAKPDEKEYAEDSSDEKVAKIKTNVVADDNIIDNSYTLVDDTESFKDIMPVVKKKDISKDAKLIVLDAGHGGKDAGARGPHGVKEKDINLAIVLYLEKIFKRDKDFKVILTRDRDTFISLSKRAEIANNKKADMFISVHCNANMNRNASGFEVYFLSENASDTEAFATQNLENSVIALEDADDEKADSVQKLLWSMAFTEYINESSELASFISCESSGRLKIPNRGTKQANFYVLRGTQMASVLVESAYLSNYTEESKLQKSSFQKAVADAIYEGVKKYYARKAKQAEQ